MYVMDASNEINAISVKTNASAWDRYVKWIRKQQGYTESHTTELFWRPSKAKLKLLTFPIFPRK